ncbi:MAG: DNA translocase FtsK [Oscillospiraceae bacterium]|nr:DNA translocase FtsK [Oscillospiraceae bacterium]
MATTQKKTTKSPPKKTGTTKKNTKRISAPPPYHHGLRLTVGVVMLLLALCVLVTYFGVEATVLHALSTLMKGLFGYGYYLVAVALGYCGWCLINHKKKPVVLRAFCILVLPLLLGTLLHLFLAKTAFGYGMDALKPLWTAGQTMQCGGALGGVIAAAGAEFLSRVVTAIVVVVLMVICVIVGLRIKPQEVLENARRRRAEREAAYAELEEQERLLAEKKAREEAKSVKPAAKKPAVHIPLEDEVEEKPLFTPAEASFFPRRAGDIKTPAEVWGGAVSEAPSPVAEEKTGEEQPPVTEEKPVRRRKVSAKEEVDSAAAEVSEAIEKELAEEEEAYRYPPITLLEENTDSDSMAAGFELRENARRLADTITSFGVDAKPGEVVRGPSVTRYEFTLDQGVKLSKLTNLSDDIALALGASGVRIAPIPGKIAAVGIEVPNRTVTSVRIRDVVESRNFVTHPSTVAFAVGKDISGNAIVGNIARLPHVLIAGTTGSGKSVCTNSLIVSLLYKSTPEEVRFIMVDPKMVELAPYNGIPHLLIPVVTDPKKAAGALQWAVFEMMKRYKMFSERGVKDLAGFNALAESGEEEELKKLPTVVVVIDELADLMLVAAKEVEESICRVAQMGRAAGVHLVIATQRPSADVITGLMKANIPSRIAFAVASAMESRIILDTPGAEKLVGKGDMLYFPLGDNKPTRVQGCFITPEEIERVVNFVKESGEADYSNEVMEKIEEAMKQSEKGSKGSAASSAAESEGSEGCDEMLAAAVEVIFETGQASVSMLQRRLKLGYSRAARLVDQMEERGIVGPFEGSKPRQVLITRQQWQELQMKGGAYAPAEEPELPPVDRYGSVRDVFDSRDALE